LDALGKALALIGRCAPLERQWSGWISGSLLDAQELNGPDGSTMASLHVLFVERCVDEGPFSRDRVLLDETVAHWRGLLSDPGRRRTALYGVAQIMLNKITLCGRLPDSVLPCLDPGMSEAAAIKDGFNAVRRGDEGRATQIAMSLLGGLREP
jgi:hypothetical protein